MTTLGINGTTSTVNYLNKSNQSLFKSILQLASGSRLADPSDDAAGVAVSGNLTAQLNRLQDASSGVVDTVSLAQTTDGFLSTIQNQLGRLSALAISASDQTLGPAAQGDYNTEFNTLLNQVSQIANNATFNGVSLFSSQNISTAVNADGVTDSVVLTTLGGAASLGLSGASVATPSAALQALAQVNNAINLVTGRRAEVNADISKFNFHISNIESEEVNTTDADSRITDLDVASASTRRAQSSIQSDAATSVLAQANADRRYVLALLS